MVKIPKTALDPTGAAPRMLPAPIHTWMPLNGPEDKLPNIHVWRCNECRATVWTVGDHEPGETDLLQENVPEVCPGGGATRFEREDPV